jgi:plastocyanin
MYEAFQIKNGNLVKVTVGTECRYIDSASEAHNVITNQVDQRSLYKNRPNFSPNHVLWKRL